MLAPCSMLLVGTVPLAAFSPGLAAVAALAAVAVPVVIHLLFRKRYQIIPWAAVRFLFMAEKRHRRRIEQWALLAVRMLAILLPLLAMLAAMPWMESLWQTIRAGEPETLAHASRTHHIFVLDASLSMSATDSDDQNKSRFTHAKQMLKEVIRAANAGDGFTLIALVGSPQMIVPGPSNDPDKVLAELDAIGPTHAVADSSATLALIGDALARSPRAYPRRQVTIFTDLQRSAWASTLPRSEEGRPDAWQKLVGRAEVAVVDLAGTDLDNVAVTHVAIEDAVPLIGQPITVTVTIQNFGQSERRLVDIEMEVERPVGTAAPPPPPRQAVTRRLDSIPAGEQATVTFNLEGLHGFRDRGPHVVRVKLREGDQLAADDTRSVVVEVRDALSVVLVNGKPDAEPLRRASEYLSRALAPPGAKPGTTPARPRTLTPTEFADPVLGDLSNIDCVFLCDVPNFTPATVARLEAHLKRGGGLVIGLGPNAAANRDAYNRLLFNDGNGLLPGPLGSVASAGSEEPGFRLAADNAAFRGPPLAAFASDTARAGLVTVPFRSYVRLEVPADGRGQRVLSFVPADQAPTVTDAQHSPDAAVVAWPRHRGRVVVFTSTFNAEWTDWPVLPSYLPFAHELLRFAVSNPDRHNLRVGDAIEEFFPATSAGQTATLSGPGTTLQRTIELQDETGVVRFPETRLNGTYRLEVGGDRNRVFAVNVVAANPAGGSESDLHRLGPKELKLLPAVQFVTDYAAIAPTSEEGTGQPTTMPRPWGPGIARVLVLFVLALLLLEVMLAWRLGPARAGGVSANAVRPVERKWWLRPISSTAAAVILFAGVAVVAIWAHAEVSGQLLGFLPEDWRQSLESAAGVPAAAPGEGTRWRLESLSTFSRGGTNDRLIARALAIAAFFAIVWVYLRERRAVGSTRRVVLPALLRFTVLLIALFIVLPQLRVAFDREGWPDVAIVLDTSASMGTVDDIKDPAVREKADELAKIAGVPSEYRLRLAQHLLTRPGMDWLDHLLTRRQVKVHIYTVADQTRLVATADEPQDAGSVRDTLLAVKPDGPASRLGDGVQAVLKAFRGSSLAAVVMFTDGINTAGDELPKAGREAARSGVPLFFVGVGDTREKPDLILADLQAEEVVTANDEMVFQARLTARGPDVPKTVPVVLYEKRGEALMERARVTVSPDATGNPVPVELRYTPKEPGERTFVIEVPALPGETDTANNRLQRVVVVAESKRARVLFIEGYPRYEYRFVKALLERETDARGGTKAVDLKVLLLDASPGWAETDRSALPEFPTRDQLFEYDMVILGDVDPRQLPKPARAAQDLADFVRIRGGGLLLIAGEHAGPLAFADTPLADVLPVVPGESYSSRITPDNQPITDGFRLKPTATGFTHPLFRFAPGEVDSRKIATNLQPMFWFATGYKRKLSAEVLATHPAKLADGGAAGEFHPLVLQQFAGSGRVLFLGFDETWRWRFRSDEEHFNRFWKQAIRMLSRSRLGRIELRLDKQTPYRRDEKMTVTVRFPDDTPAPPDGAAVRVAVQHTPAAGTERIGPDTTTLQLAKIPGSRATYRAALTRTSEGEYRFWLTEPEVAGSRPRAEAKVLPPHGEMDRLDMDRAELVRAAEESHGKFYTLAEADRVLDDLPDVPRVPLNQPCPPFMLWNQPLLYALMALLLTSEWLLRKRERLL